MARGAAVRKVTEAEVILVFVDNEGAPHQVGRLDPLQEIRIGAALFDIA